MEEEAAAAAEAAAALPALTAAAAAGPSVASLQTAAKRIARRWPNCRARPSINYLRRVVESIKRSLFSDTAPRPPFTVIHLLRDQGWVDFDLGVPPSCPAV